MKAQLSFVGPKHFSSDLKRFGIAKQAQQLHNNNKNMIFVPTIHLMPTGKPSYDQQISDQVIERLNTEFALGMMRNMDVARRVDKSLVDKSWPYGRGGGLAIRLLSRQLIYYFISLI
ncbi:hypothetical protein [Marinomonas sp. FW-1]|uniref:hypothetical protein n=1 Tax=Marinomonas sp. FW-1 TaxID=2071621 RepID=UPI0010BFF053|nr:hypothetical protein [Marinomonas sp. FW-1]